jgi:hypothetical protein
MEKWLISTRSALIWTRSAEAELKYPVRSCDQDWFRLIPSRFPIIDVYERFGSEELRTAAKELEGLTNPRLAAIANEPAAVSGGNVATHQYQNWNHAPFVYKNPEGTWFAGPSYGVLEVAADHRSALALALLRRETFLSRTDEAPINLEMRMLSTRIIGSFVDLTALDRNLSEAERWAIGQELYDDGAAGVIFQRPHFASQRFLGAFDGSVLGRSVQGSHYKFLWDGKTIKSVYDFTDGTEILRAELLHAARSRDAA